MTPPRTPKLSGAELAAQLAGTAFPKPALAAPVPPAAETLPVDPAPEPAPEKPVREKLKPAVRPKGGRPSKAGAGGEAIPVNVRLALDDHGELARIAVELLVPGRPVPTVQDVVRGLVRGALQDHEALKKLVRKGGI
jgi:hypothetical protein